MTGPGDVSPLYCCQHENISLLITNDEHKNLEFFKICLKVLTKTTGKNHRYFSVCCAEACTVCLEKLLFRICFNSILLCKEDIV